MNGQIQRCGYAAARRLKEAHITGPELVHAHPQQGDPITAKEQGGVAVFIDDL